MSDPFGNYDAWLEAPYQQAADAAECPDCGSAVEEDTHERTADCTNPDCGWSYEFDWDALAEARAEARAGY